MPTRRGGITGWVTILFQFRRGALQSGSSGGCCAVLDHRQMQASTDLEPQPFVQTNGRNVIRPHVQNWCFPSLHYPGDQKGQERASISSSGEFRMGADCADLSETGKVKPLARHRHERTGVVNPKIG